MSYLKQTLLWLGLVLIAFSVLGYFIYYRNHGVSPFEKQPAMRMTAGETPAVK